MDRCAPWLLALAVLVTSLSIYRDWERVTIVLSAVVAAGACVLARRRRWPLFAAAAAGWITLGMWPATVVASYYAGTSLHSRRALAGFVAAATAAVGVPATVGVVTGDYRWISRSVGDVVLLVGGQVLVPLVVGLWVDARRQVLSGLRERARQLEREQQSRAERARAEERARIAREMHDVVAHRVTLMVLQAGALQVSAPDPGTVEAAGAIRQIGREALAELRQVLGVLRSSQAVEAVLAPQPVLADLDGLIESVRAMGVLVHREDQGEVRPLPAALERAIYRIVQEALLNVRKHAPSAATRVVLRYGAHIGVEVHNSPAGRDPGATEPLPHSGLGLAGVAERVGLLGGDLTARPMPDGGFLVRAVFPPPAPETDIEADRRGGAR